MRSEQVQSKFKKVGLRVEVDRGSERLAKQIRTAEKVRVEAACVFFGSAVLVLSVLPVQ